MDKYDFIKRLDDALAPLSESERESALSYYKELFEDAGSEKESELIEHLGSPESIAESIIRESGMVLNAENNSDKTEEKEFDADELNHKDKKYHEKKRDNTTILLIVLVILLTSPVWAGVAAGALGVIIAIVVAVFALLAAFAITGIALLGTGISLLFTSIGAGILLAGIGLLFIGMVILLFMPLFAATIKFCVWLVRAVVKLFHSMFYKREAVA